MNGTVVNITCGGKCVRYYTSDRGYKNGAKRCMQCSIMIIYDGTYCPCCNQKLRTRARNPKNPRKVRRI